MKQLQRAMRLYALLTLYWLSASIIPAYAKDYAEWPSPEALPAVLQHPLRLLATTGRSGVGQDYISLAPGQTLKIGEIVGPAIIFRLWSTSSDPKHTALYMIVDGHKQTLVARGKLPPGISAADPLRGLDKEAYWSYVPVLIRKRALFLARSLAPQGTPAIRFYLQAAYRSVTPSELAEAQRWDLRAFRAILQRLRAGKIDIPGEEHTLTVSAGQSVAVPVPGPALVTELALSWPATLTAAAAPDIETLRGTRLLLLFDGVKTVDAPLLGLVGRSFQPRHSVALDVNEGTIVLRFPMPYAQNMQLGLESAGPQRVDSLTARLRIRRLPKAPRYRFCGQYFAQYSQNEQPMTLLDISGEGLFVGMHLSVDGQERKTFAFLEGNEQLYIDEATKPTLEGTGTEDFFNNAWYFSAAPLSHAFHGVTFKQEREPLCVSAYRYLLSDCLPFKKRLRFDLQHGSRNRAPGVLYEGLFFWYQAAPGHEAALPSRPTPPPSPFGMAEAPKSPARSNLGIVVAGFVGALMLVAWLAWRRRRTRSRL